VAKFVEMETKEKMEMNAAMRMCGSRLYVWGPHTFQYVEHWWEMQKMQPKSWENVN
jgi:hypothetical protein